MERGGSMTETERIFAARFSNEEIYDFVDDVLINHAHQRAEAIRMSINIYNQLGEPADYKGIRIETDRQLWPDNVVQVAFRA